MKQLLFVVNPRAGRGVGERVGRALQQSLLRDNLEFDLVYTRHSGEGELLARETAADTVVAVGGDGTVNEVVNGISGSEKKLAIVPAGSGNDVVKSLSIPANPEQALEVIKNGVVRVVDSGIVSWKSPDGRKSRLFLNGIGMGFDAAVAHKASTIPRLRGTLLYLAAVLRTLTDFRPPDFRVEADGSVATSGRKLLIALGNGRCAGGGFYLTPEASVEDGLLDMCAVEAMGVSGILRLIPRVLKGSHLRLREVVYLKGRNFAVTSTSSFAVHADGESMSTSTDNLDVRVQPGSIRVFVPSMVGG